MSLPRKRESRKPIPGFLLPQSLPLRKQGNALAVAVQPAGILKYFEDLKREPNTGFGPKDIFEIDSY
jgi:hypothetical protein